MYMDVKKKNADFYIYAHLSELIFFFFKGSNFVFFVAIKMKELH